MPAPAADTVARPAQGSAPSHDASNLSRLEQLWRERSGGTDDFAVGPGDVLDVSVPGIDELKDRRVRVDGAGEIALPLVGEIEARGLTEEGLRKELCSRLGKFMYHPQAEIFFKSFSSRQVAVTGAVHSPGMYVLNGPHDTLRDVLERAGGISESAAQQVALTPQESDPARAIGAHDPPDEKSPGADARAGMRGVMPASLDLTNREPPAEPPTRGAPVLIDMVEGSAERRFIDLPMRPGDTVYVPQAGHVTVVGWVYYPKVMDITPGLSVLGAVAAAGGPLYAADMNAVKLIRQGPQGNAVVIEINLNRVKRLEDRDVAVQSNDVVEVGYSVARLPGYAVYYAAGSIFTWMPAAAIMTGIP